MTTETALTLPERAAVALGTAEHEKQLVLLAQESKSIVAIKNADGRTQCHATYMRLKNARVAITNTAEAAREDATKFSKAVIAEERRLITITQAEETRLQGLRDQWDADREAERQAAIAAEAKRIADIRTEIAEIQQYPIDAVGKSSAEIQIMADSLSEVVVDDHFAEFKDQATASLTAALTKVSSLLVLAKEHEAEVARIAAEREELKKLAEQRETEAKALKELQDKEAAELRAKQEAEMAVERERLATIAREQAEARAKIEADRQALEAERAALNPPAPVEPVVGPAITAAEEQPAIDLAALKPETFPGPAWPFPPAALGTITLRFEGASDDTFGEFAHFKDSYDNCASGTPIDWLVTAPGVVGGLVVSGQYARTGTEACWMVGVAAYDPNHDDLSIPDWPIKVVRSERGYSPALVIEAPSNATIKCMQLEEAEA
jgi:hypothetical protein